MKVCRIADQNKDEDDLPEPQDVPQTHDSDSNSESQSTDDMTGMGFDPNNFSPIPPVGNVAIQQGAALPTSMPKSVGEIELKISDPTHNRGRANIVNSFANNKDQVGTQKKSSKGGKVKSSQAKGQPQPSTSNQGPTGNTGRPQVQCTACGGSDNLRKDCHEDVFCTQCRTRSHITEMCHVPIKSGKNDSICFYCGSTNHISSKCPNRPNNNREEPRSTPRDIQSWRTGNKSHVSNQNRDSHQQARFDKRYNRQYSPNYKNVQSSPVSSVPGPDLSATLIELANIQSRSLEMMAASQRSQQVAFHKLTRASREKANDAMFANIKSYDGKDRHLFKDWIDEIDQACWVSEHDFRNKIINKLTGVVRQVVMSCRNLSR